jgi:hypothetical protein
VTTGGSVKIAKLCSLLNSSRVRLLQDLLQRLVSRRECSVLNIRLAHSNGRRSECATDSRCSREKNRREKLRLARKTFPRRSIHTEISPLRYATVEMTKGRAVLSWRVVAQWQPLFRTFSGPKAHDPSFERTKGKLLNGTLVVFFAGPQAHRFGRNDKGSADYGPERLLGSMLDGLA